MNVFLSTIMSFLSADSFNDISDAISELINDMWIPCLAVASALVVIWGVYLGVKYWTSAGDETKKKSAKSAVVSFVIGIIIIFVVAVGAPMLIGALTTWASSY